MFSIITFQYLAGGPRQALTSAHSATQRTDCANALVTSILKRINDVQKLNRESSRRGGLGAS